MLNQRSFASWPESRFGVKFKRDEEKRRLFNRVQAVIISILTGLVVLVFIGLAAILLLPGEVTLRSTPTSTATIPPTATPTFPNFMPTAGGVTPTPGEPTPTNTRLPTSTPLPTRTPRPTLIINLPTPVVRPTATPTAAPLPPPTVAREPSPTATPLVQRQYSVSFEAEDTSLVEGECTDIIWRVEGAVNIELDGDSVGQSGREKVCPDEDSSYRLTFQIAGSTEIGSREVEILVESDD